MKEEIWKDIENYEGLYQVSSFGKVRRLSSIVVYSNGNKTNHKERILSLEKTNLNKRGKYYLRVTLSKNNKQKRFLVHRLVALHFISNLEEKKCVNHIDGNPENNNVLNLEWCTHSENERHSYDVLGKINPIRKLKDIEVEDIRKNAIKRVNTDLFMDKYNVDRSTILNVLNRKYYV